MIVVRLKSVGVMDTGNTLIRHHGCPDWSESFLFIHGSLFTRPVTVELQWLQPWWLIYYDYFELVLESLEFFSITANIIWDNSRALILFWKWMLCVLIRIEAILISSYNILLFLSKSKIWPYNASCPGSTINPHWLKLPLSQTHYHSPKGIQAVKVQLYVLVKK